MKENREKLVIDGNAFYEIDLECVREKEQKKRQIPNRSDGQKNTSKRQRG